MELVILKWIVPLDQIALDGNLEQSDGGGISFLRQRNFCDL